MFTLQDRMTFQIESLIRRKSEARTTREFNADLRRLLPWPGHADTKRGLTEFGAMVVTLRAQEDVEPHRHDEEECFIVVSGQADLIVEGQTTTLGEGDVAYLPRFWTHQLRNRCDVDFQFVDLFWDDRQRSFEEYERSEGVGPA